MELRIKGVDMTSGNLRIAAVGADLRTAAHVLWRMAGRAAAVICCRMEVAQQRRRLSMLDDMALKDIGISRADAEAEAGRTFWDLPAEPGFCDLQRRR